MKKLLVIIFIFLGTVYSQDSLTVSVDDWNFVKKTYQETDSSLVECEALSKLYLQRIDVFKAEVYSLRQAVLLTDSIEIKKNEIIQNRQQQVDLLTARLEYKNKETWIYRGYGALMTGIVLILLF